MITNTLLNLPPFDHKCKEIDGKTCIFDIVRRKYLVLTPEEWVRQHFVNMLLYQYNYPKSLIRLEGGLTYNRLQKRSDIIVFNQQAQPFLLIECKNTQVVVDHRVIQQASRYNLITKAPFLAVTNGLSTFCFEINFDENKSRQMQDLPPFV